MNSRKKSRWIEKACFVFVSIFFFAKITQKRKINCLIILIESFLCEIFQILQSGTLITLTRSLALNGKCNSRNWDWKDSQPPKTEIFYRKQEFWKQNICIGLKIDFWVIFFWKRKKRKATHLHIQTDNIFKEKLISHKMNQPSGVYNQDNLA